VRDRRRNVPVSLGRPQGGLLQVVIAISKVTAQARLPPVGAHPVRDRRCDVVVGLGRPRGGLLQMVIAISKVTAQARLPL